VSAHSSPIVTVSPDIIATTKVVIDTRGQGFTEITHEVARFIAEAKAKDGALFLFMRHTSASLVIQENADPDVEGPDDMPAHIKTMLTDVSIHVPVIGGALALGTWQGIYVAEHRARPHRREIMLQFIGSKR
jgi:thiamine phosphate synthase YjbQ (UPF0047 family)